MYIPASGIVVQQSVTQLKGFRIAIDFTTLLCKICHTNSIQSLRHSTYYFLCFRLVNHHLFVAYVHLVNHCLLVTYVHLRLHHPILRYEPTLCSFRIWSTRNKCRNQYRNCLSQIPKTNKYHLREWALEPTTATKCGQT